MHACSLTVNEFIADGQSKLSKEDAEYNPLYIAQARACAYTFILQRQRHHLSDLLFRAERQNQAQLSYYTHY